MEESVAEILKILTERKSIEASSLSETIYHEFISCNSDWNNFIKSYDEELLEADVANVCGMVLSYASRVAASVSAGKVDELTFAQPLSFNLIDQVLDLISRETFELITDQAYTVVVDTGDGTAVVKGRRDKSLRHLSTGVCLYSWEVKNLKTRWSNGRNVKDIAQALSQVKASMADVLRKCGCRCPPMIGFLVSGLEFVLIEGVFVDREFKFKVCDPIVLVNDNYKVVKRAARVVASMLVYSFKVLQGSIKFVERNSARGLRARLASMDASKFYDGGNNYGSRSGGGSAKGGDGGGKDRGSDGKGGHGSKGGGDRVGTNGSGGGKGDGGGGGKAGGGRSSKSNRGTSRDENRSPAHQFKPKWRRQ